MLSSTVIALTPCASFALVHWCRQRASKKSQFAVHVHSWSLGFGVSVKVDPRPTNGLSRYSTGALGDRTTLRLGLRFARDLRFAKVHIRCSHRPRHHLPGLVRATDGGLVRATDGPKGSSLSCATGSTTLGRCSRYQIVSPVEANGVSATENRMYLDP
jgi:hypothetical protein